VDLLIKLEVCDILNQYLDQKMDFCLNVIKVKFREYVSKLNLMEKLESGELYIDVDRKNIRNNYSLIMIRGIV
jgi:inositol 1,4,5-triphosphate receptor type 1/inositol 1,4,5-triphosphate receptor type 3